MCPRCGKAEPFAAGEILSAVRDAAPGRCEQLLEDYSVVCSSKLLYVCGVGLHCQPVRGQGRELGATLSTSVRIYVPSDERVRFVRGPAERLGGMRVYEEPRGN